MQIPSFWLIASWLITSIAGFWLASFIKPYLGERAKNLATHDDLDKLTQQIETTTKAAKRIEAKIDDQVWNRQRHWEMKRDAVVDVIRAMSASEDALMATCALYQMSLKDSANPKVKEEYEKATLDWKDKITEFESKRIIAKLICGDEFNAALSAVRGAIRGGMKRIMKRSIQSYDEIGPSVSPAVYGAVMAARKELGLPDEEAIVPAPEVPEE